MMDLSKNVWMLKPSVMTVSCGTIYLLILLNSLSSLSFYLQKIKRIFTAAGENWQIPPQSSKQS